MMCVCYLTAWFGCVLLLGLSCGWLVVWRVICAGFACFGVGRSWLVFCGLFWLLWCFRFVYGVFAVDLFWDLLLLLARFGCLGFDCCGASCWFV